MKNATVAKLKQAVEAAFSHLPRQGDCKISWYVHLTSLKTHYFYTFYMTKLVVFAGHMYGDISAYVLSI